MDATASVDVSTWPLLLHIGNTSKSATITLRAITLVITQWGGRSSVAL